MAPCHYPSHNRLIKQKNSALEGCDPTSSGLIYVTVVLKDCEIQPRSYKTQNSNDPQTQES